MTSRKNKIILFTGIVVLCAVALREIGVVDFDLYRSVINSSHVASKSQRNLGSDKGFSYTLTLKHEGEAVFAHTHTNGNSPPIEIEAILAEPVYSGSSAMPFAKNFKMTFQCAFTTLKSPTGHTVDGKIEGEVTAKIHGICSRRKAKELAFEEAVKQIKTYFQQQLR